MESNLIFFVSIGVFLSPFLRHSVKTIDGYFERQTKQQARAVRVHAQRGILESVYLVDHRCSVDADLFIRLPCGRRSFDADKLNNAVFKFSRRSVDVA